VLTDLLNQVQDFKKRSDEAGRHENLKNKTQAVATTQVRILGHLGVEGPCQPPSPSSEQSPWFATEQNVGL